MANRTKFTLKKREKFLEILSKTSNVSEAAKAVGMSRHGVYDVRNTNAGFAKEWDDAVETGLDALEREAIRRGMEGVEEPVFYQGDEVARVRKYSDTLLIFMLKGGRPEKFRENLALQHSGEMSVNIKGYAIVSPDDWPENSDT